MSAMADPPRLQGRDIVCVGFADWDTDLQTNQHHLMKRLARENRVLFVESLGLRRPQIAGRDVKRIARRLVRGLRGAREVDGLHVLSPLVLPLHANPLARRINGWLLPALVSRAARRLGMDKPILWAYVPQAEVLLAALRPEIVVYHCVDDMAAQQGIDGPSFRASEERFAARAGLVLASAPALAQRLGTIARNVLYVPNVADIELFSSALQDGTIDAGMARLPSPRIVFTGALVTTKLDMGLLLALAESRRDWSFALVGPTGPGDPRADMSALAAQPNIHLLGPRPYEELPSVLRGADAGLIPYAINQLTRSIFPMKVYEYLAAGLPVIATPLAALEGVEGVVTAADASGVAALIEEALAKDTPERKAARAHEAEAHSWERRLEEIGAAVPALEASEGQSGMGRDERTGRPDAGATGDPATAGDLLVTMHTPALRSGRDVRTYGVARALAANGPLTLLYVRFGAETPDEAYEAIPGIQLLEVVPSRGRSRLCAYIRARLRGVPDGFARGVSAELAASAARLASAPGRGRVIADGPTAAAALTGLTGKHPLIYNAHNLESGFRHELGEERKSLRGLASFERRLLQRSAESWLVSEADMQTAHELCPSAELRLVPNVVDVTAIQPVPGNATEPVTIFVANFAYEPNRTALRFLLEDVLPRVWTQLPDAHLMLVGAGLEQPPGDDSRVHTLGFVENLADVYAQARCAVVPLLHGGGSPLKLIEAFAYGLPVVATPRAVAGLDVHEGVDCLVAEDAHMFAEALTRVLRDGSPEIAHAGRRLAEERYSVEALAALLRA
jgi:glycosyltransferase involved in cell wall biosynthesis